MDKRQFSDFYELYLERIYRFVLFRVGNKREVAEDITQDVFLRAFEAFERYDPAKGQASWIYTIARNCLINHHAKLKPGVTLEEIEGSLLASHDERERFSENHDERALMQAITRLSDEDARLIRMKYLEGWSFEDVAPILGKTSTALRVQATRAIKKLRQFVKHPDADLYL